MVNTRIPFPCASAQNSFLPSLLSQAKPFWLFHVLKKRSTSPSNQHEPSVNHESLWQLIVRMAGLVVGAGEGQEAVV